MGSGEGRRMEGVAERVRLGPGAMCVCSVGSCACVQLGLGKRNLMDQYGVQGQLRT